MTGEGNVLDLFYQAALFPEHWPSAIEALAGLAGAAGGMLFVSGGTIETSIASGRLGATLNEFFAQDWMTRNTRTPRLLALPPVRFYGDSEVFDDRALLADPMQAELLMPAGFGREVATRIVTPSGDNVILSMHKAFDSGRYAAEGMACLDRARPHLAHALMLAARLGLQRLHGMVEVLDAVGLAAAVIDRTGVVLASNNRLDGEQELDAAAFARLGFKTAGARQAFCEALARLNRSPDTLPQSIALRHPDGSPASVLHLVPLRLGARDLMSGAVAIALVTPVASVTTPEPATLRTLFGLTVAEARVACALMTRTVGQIAGASSVSVNTVRTQVRAVLSKTGSRNQSELSALLARVASLDPAGRSGCV